VLVPTKHQTNKCVWLQSVSFCVSLLQTNTSKTGIKAFFIEHRGYNNLRRTAEGGHDAAAYLNAILFYGDNGGAAADDTAKGYMRWVVGGDTTTSRWLSNEGCLPLREKATRVLHYSTWRIWGEPLPPRA
jgi:hypothetical protein